MVKKDGAELPGSEPISFPITIMVVAYLLQLTQSATTSTELGMFQIIRLDQNAKILFLFTFDPHFFSMDPRKKNVKFNKQNCNIILFCASGG